MRIPDGCCLRRFCGSIRFSRRFREAIDIPAHEGYSLEKLCGTLFYLDVFGFRSMEDFKRVYPEEFGLLIGRSGCPSHFTLRRFLHQVRKHRISEEPIEQLAEMYLKEGFARWGVLYIDAHSVPYYGMYPISKGWHGVQKKPEMIETAKNVARRSGVGEEPAERVVQLMCR